MSGQAREARGCGRFMTEQTVATEAGERIQSLEPIDVLRVRELDMSDDRFDATVRKVALAANYFFFRRTNPSLAKRSRMAPYALFVPGPLQCHRPGGLLHMTGLALQLQGACVITMHRRMIGRELGASGGDE